MPRVVIPQKVLKPFGRIWVKNGGSLSRTPPYSSGLLGQAFDAAVAKSLSVMLGKIRILPPINSNALLPPQPNCVELGATRIIGGVRPQNFDVCYRPDGVRFAFDSKTLNDLKSVGKNYQNMINDLATEATTVHTRFPYAVVAFLVAIPEPCLVEPQRAALVGTLSRLAIRVHTTDHSHLAEAISLVVWNPKTGMIDKNVPERKSRLRIEYLSSNIQLAYFRRYRGLPPHTV